MGSERNQIYLIVDDDADDIDFFCEAIHEIYAGALCYIARNGEEALKWLRQKMDALPDFTLGPCKYKITHRVKQ